VDVIQTLKTLIYHYDEPFADLARFPLYLLSRFARKHAKVPISVLRNPNTVSPYRLIGGSAVS
jgi:hypothetical protein